MVADFHAIGATMEDVGKNVVANMSGTASSSSICAKAVAGEGKTLMEVWCVVLFCDGFDSNVRVSLWLPQEAYVRSCQIHSIGGA